MGEQAKETQEISKNMARVAHVTHNVADNIFGIMEASQNTTQEAGHIMGPAAILAGRGYAHEFFCGPNGRL